MNAVTRVPDDGAPNPGQDVSDETEPEEEYELDQVTNERDGQRDPGPGLGE